MPHTAAEMYRLVSDVESYPDFLPWCSDARVHETSETHQVATIVFAKSLRRTEFTTRNRLEPEHAIHVSLVEGPFRRLEGSWRFTDLDGGGCRCDLEVEFSFAGRLLATLMGPAFNRVCDALVGAFLRRADALYGAAAGKTAPS